MRLPMAYLDRVLGGDTNRVAARLGVSSRQVWRYRDTGLTAQQADKMAARAGYRAWEVWGEMYEDAEDWNGEWPRPDSWRARVSSCSDACRCVA